MNDATLSGKIPQDIERILLRVETPGQYVGGETNIQVKDDTEVDFRVALAFPDVYSIGMSHHGLRILYDIGNNQKGVQCERVFSPLPDMEEQMRENGIPLRTLETFRPLRAFDLVGFSLQYEMCATTVLTMLDLGGIPLKRTERNESHPLIIAGGHMCLNPEPVSDFFDIFMVGEAEEAFEEIIRFLQTNRETAKKNRGHLLATMAKEIKGLYIPALYDTRSNQSGFICVDKSDEGAPLPVRRRIVENFADAPIPTSPIVPVCQTVHERVTMEVMRGCPNGCRFCQAGFICRPQRERPVETLVNAALQTYKNTGYDEIGLLSLSTSDYSGFDKLVEQMDKTFAPLGVSLSLPSLRVDHALSDIPKRFKSVRKSGLTIAPEAGTDRLRSVINKHVTDEDLMNAAEEAFHQGWQTIKLYFMVGLPTETEEDVRAIAELANRIARLRKKSGRKPGVNLSASNFVPKGHTPFQWEKMDSMESLKKKHGIIHELADRKRVTCKFHDPYTSFLEGVFARGDRKLGAAILKAWEKGARLDSWTDYFRPAAWDEAFKECDIATEEYACRERNQEETQPWSHIDNGVRIEFLKKERQRSREAIKTQKCSKDNCAGCGMENCPFHSNDK